MAPTPTSIKSSLILTSPEQSSHVTRDKHTRSRFPSVFHHSYFLPTTRFLMDDASVLDPNVAKTQKALQEIRDLPAALLKIAFDLLIPTDRALPASFWAPYNDDERNIGLRACLLVWTVTDTKLVPQEFQLEATIAITYVWEGLID